MLVNPLKLFQGVSCFKTKPFNMSLHEYAREIREEILKYQTFHGLVFTEENHSYTMKKMKKGLSVSSLIKMFHKPFDSHSTYTFVQCGGDIQIQKELLLSWENKGKLAANKGSRTHYYLEKYLLDTYNYLKPVREPEIDCSDREILESDLQIEAGQKFVDLMHSRGCVLIDTETVMGHPDEGYFGQSDKVWLARAKDGRLGYIITDWKGLPLETPMFTDSGWKTMGTLRISDKVYDKDGELVSIKNISDIVNKKCLKITFDNKEEIVSDFEHRWLVFTQQGKKRKKIIMTTQEIKDYYDNLNKKTSFNILKIENPVALNNRKKVLPIDPYVLGMWLGDGNKCDAKITKGIKKIWEEISKRGYGVGRDIGQQGGSETRTVFGLQKHLRSLNLLNHKHLPDTYLHGSKEQRLDLLRGLMDSDGYYNKARNLFVMDTTSPTQIGLYNQVISSLGIKTTQTSFLKKYKTSKIRVYRIEFFTSEFNPFLCRNQINFPEKKGDRRSFRVIKKVEEVESVPTRCIEVDSSSSTYLFGYSFIVTHNTNKIKNMEPQSYNGFMLPPFESLRDYAVNHYKLQLPFYGRLFKKLLKGTQFEDLKYLGSIIVSLGIDGNFREFRVEKEIADKVFNLDVKKELLERKALLDQYKAFEKRDQKIKEYESPLNF